MTSLLMSQSQPSPIFTKDELKTINDALIFTLHCLDREKVHLYSNRNSSWRRLKVCWSRSENLTNCLSRGGTVNIISHENNNYLTKIEISTKLQKLVNILNSNPITIQTHNNWNFEPFITSLFVHIIAISGIMIIKLN